MPASIHDQGAGFYFWDTDNSGANPIARYSCVSLATPTEVDAAIAAGNTPSGLQYGDVVVKTPISGGVPTRRILGVTGSSGWSLGSPRRDLIQVHLGGIVEVQFNAAITPAAGTLLTAVATETRTSVQTPFTNNFDMLLPFDSTIAVTYRLCLAGELTITPASSGANAAYYPLGYLLDTPGAKYDILRIQLDPRVLYA